MAQGGLPAVRPPLGSCSDGGRRAASRAPGTRADGNIWVQSNLDGNPAADFEIVLLGSRTLTAAGLVL